MCYGPFPKRPSFWPASENWPLNFYMQSDFLEVGFYMKPLTQWLFDIYCKPKCLQEEGTQGGWKSRCWVSKRGLQGLRSPATVPDVWCQFCRHSQGIMMEQWMLRKLIKRQLKQWLSSKGNYWKENVLLGEVTHSTPPRKLSHVCSIWTTVILCSEALKSGTITLWISE